MMRVLPNFLSLFLFSSIPVLLNSLIVMLDGTVTAARDPSDTVEHRARRQVPLWSLEEPSLGPDAGV